MCRSMSDCTGSQPISGKTTVIIHRVFSLRFNRVIVDLREVTPKRGGKIYIPDFDEITVEVENYLKQGEHYVLCEVKA